MRDFHGAAAEAVAASVEDCLALLAEVERYPDWCPDNVRAVEVLERGADGQASSIRMTIHVDRGGFDREFDLFLTVVVEPPGTVKLTRVRNRPTSQEFTATWTLTPAGRTRVALDLDAKLRVPSFIRADGIADAIAEGFVTAACRELAVPSQ